jgi:hypothetical protein
MNQNFSFGYKTQWLNPILLNTPGLLLPPAPCSLPPAPCLLPPDSHLVPKISKIVKKINKNFRPLYPMPSGLDYLSK